MGVLTEEILGQAGVRALELVMRRDYETKRADLIEHGGESLEKILTDKKYAQIRKEFGIDEGVDYKKEIHALDADSKKQLEHSTLRDIVDFKQLTPELGQYNLESGYLKRLLTPTADISQQIRNVTGGDAKKFDPTTMGEDEHRLHTFLSERAASDHIIKSPDLYIRHGNTPNTPSVIHTELKDGTQAVIVGLEDWKKQKGVEVSNDIARGLRNDIEDSRAYLNQYKDISIKDILTKDEYQKVRQQFDIPDFSGKDDPAKSPEYLDKLDPKSRHLLETEKLKDLVTLFPKKDEKGNIQYSMMLLSGTQNNMLNLELLPPSDHMAQLALLDHIGAFLPDNASEDDKKKHLTLVDASKLQGDEKAFYDHQTDIARKAGLKTPPELYYRSYNTGDEGSTTILKDGTLALVLDKSIADMPPAQRIHTTAHEDGHFTILQRLKVHDAFDLANYLQKSSMQKLSKNESEADHFAAQATCNAQGQADNLRRSYSMNDPKTYAKEKDKELEALANGSLDHPLSDIRVEALERFHPTGCTPYYPPTTKKPDTPAR